MAEPVDGPGGPEADRWKDGGPVAPGVRRIAIFAAAVLVALAALGAWALRDQVLARRTEDAQRAVRILEEHVGKIVGGHFASLGQIEWFVREAGRDDARHGRLLHERLKAIADAHPEVQSIWLLDRDGETWATSVAFPPPAANQSDRDYFQAGLRGERRFIGRVIFGRVTRQHVFQVSRRIESADGALLGVAFVSLHPGYFRDFYGSIGPDADSVMLLREDGALLARHPQPEGDPTALQAAPGFMARLREADRGMVRSVAGFDTREFLYAWRRVADLPLYVVYGTAVERIAREWLALALPYALLVVPALAGIGFLGHAACRQARAVDRSRAALLALNATLETRVAQRTAALADSEARFRAMADNIPQLAWMARPDGWIFWYNKRWHDYTGTTPDEVRGWGWRTVHHPDHVERVAAHFRRQVEAGAPWEDTFPLRGRDGTYRWFLSRAMPIRDAAGRVVMWFGTNTDVADQIEDHERLKLLAREVDHRAKNMLAVLQVIARLTSADSVAAYRKAVQGRISALARAHTLLSQSRWEGASLGRLVEEELAPYSKGGGQRAVLAGPDVLLTPRAAQSLAMVVHELATNAAKYGALSRPEGRVAVAWRWRDDGRLALVWAETGGPAVLPPARAGVGHGVIERIVTQQLAGDIAFDWRPEGLVCELSVPAPDLVRRREAV